jgi:hypothetical protein
MNAVQGQARQGRSDSRPWEIWLYPGWLIIPAIAAGIGSALIGARTHHLAIGLEGMGVAALVAASSWTFNRLVSTMVNVWRRFDEAIRVHDPRWQPRRPKVTRTDRGLVVVIGPIPALDQATLHKALSTAAIMSGSRLIGFDLLPATGVWKRSYGRERLRVELSR